jgi:50S ribosomal subunit-associated GTPase HflX
MSECHEIPAPAHDAAHHHAFTLALVGNPNAGKTTLFNALTGLRAKTANFPGTTVERKVGRLHLDRQTNCGRGFARPLQPRQPIAG